MWPLLAVPNTKRRFCAVLASSKLVFIARGDYASTMVINGGSTSSIPYRVVHMACPLCMDAAWWSKNGVLYKSLYSCYKDFEISMPIKIKIKRILRLVWCDFCKMNVNRILLGITWLFDRQPNMKTMKIPITLCTKE